MSKIFISYRRDDSAGYAGRLYDRLVKHFGDDHLFMDIDQIEPGEDFVEVLQKILQAVQVAVILIGKSWLDSKDETGQRRLDNPDDWVRIEIATLLERKIRVIPVLVGSAMLPQASQIPEPLIPLVRRQAFEIRDTRFHTDVDKLIQALEKIIQSQIIQPSVKPYSISPDAVIQDDSKPKAVEAQHNSIKVASDSDQINEASGTKKSNVSRFVTIGVSGVAIVFALLIMFKPTTPEPSDSNWISEDFMVSAAPDKVAEATTELQPESKQPSSLTITETEPTLSLDFEPKMVRIPPGKFRMGSPETEQGRSSDEGPQRTVTIGYAFEISQTEITFAQYDAFASETKRPLPYDRDWGRGNRPVINVNFNDAKAYVAWLSKKTGKKYRLPTEAEWEYVARAGSTTVYWWGDAIGQNNAVCYYCGSQWDGKQTAPVGSFKPNAFGVYDTAGNVWEWTQDCWHKTYQGAPSDGSAWLQSHDGDCLRRVVRGGSWNYGPQGLRSAFRSTAWLSSVGADGYLGFRVARDL